MPAITRDEIDATVINRYYERAVNTPAAAASLSQIIVIIFSASAFAGTLVAGSSVFEPTSWRFIVPFALAAASAGFVVRVVTIPVFRSLPSPKADGNEKPAAVKPSTLAEGIKKDADAETKAIVDNARVAIGLAFAAQVVLIFGLIFPPHPAHLSSRVEVFMQSKSPAAGVAESKCGTKPRSHSLVGIAIYRKPPNAAFGDDFLVGLCGHGDNRALVVLKKSDIVAAIGTSEK